MAKIKPAVSTQHQTSTLEYFYEKLARELPVVFARRKVGPLTGWALHEKTLANIMSDPDIESPPSFRVGRTVVFEKHSFIGWLRSSGRVKVNN